MKVLIRNISRGWDGKLGKYFLYYNMYVYGFNLGLIDWFYFMHWNLKDLLHAEERLGSSWWIQIARKLGKSRRPINSRLSSRIELNFAGWIDFGPQDYDSLALTGQIVGMIPALLLPEMVKQSSTIWRFSILLSFTFNFLPSFPKQLHPAPIQTASQCVNQAWADVIAEERG